MKPCEIMDWSQLKFPYLVSEKLDGIRAMIYGGSVNSTSGKILPNYRVQNKFKEYSGIDGELIVGNPRDKDCYNKTQSAVMTFDKDVKIDLYVFDDFLDDVPFGHKKFDVIKGIEDIFIVKQTLIDNIDDLLELEESIISKGGEGIVLKSPNTKYKFGRATQREGIFFKIKRFKDAEAKVYAIEEMKNHPNTAGRFLCDFMFKSQSIQIEVGPGKFKHEVLQEIWRNRELYIGKLLKFKYMEVGTMDKPRQPIALGWRSNIDL